MIRSAQRSAGAAPRACDERSFRVAPKLGSLHGKNLHVSVLPFLRQRATASCSPPPPSLSLLEQRL